MKDLRPIIPILLSVVLAIGGGYFLIAAGYRAVALSSALERGIDSPGPTVEFLVMIGVAILAMALVTPRMTNKRSSNDRKHWTGTSSLTDDRTSRTDLNA